MSRVRSWAFNALFFAWSLLMHLAALPLLAAPGSWIYFMGKVWCRGALFLLRLVGGLRYRVTGLENLPDRPVVIAAKHQSMWETLAFCEIFRQPIFVLKQELLSIPFYGWYLRRIGMVAIDRSGGAGALRKMVAEATARLAAGKHVVIFPEGTRTKPGRRQRYHPGVAALYKQLGVPLLPVALNSGLFWPDHSFRQRPGCITVSLLPAIPPGLNHREVMARLEQVIEDESRRLLCAAGPAASEPAPLDGVQGGGH